VLPFRLRVRSCFNSGRGELPTVLAAPLQQEVSPRADVGAVYEAHRGLLVGTAVTRYGIAEPDAETLVHDVFLSYILKSEQIRDVRAWLVGAICNASKHYLRSRARAVGLPPDILNEPDPKSLNLDRLPDALAARECFACLTPRCQLALRLRYIEGYSAPEIANELDTTPKYAQKLVARCLQMAYDRYGAKGART
jgi:RNA polymerase sigma factor (sigma-70 family)